MQNRPNIPAVLHYEPMELPEDFPFICGGFHSPDTDPVQFLHVHNFFEIGYCYEGVGIFLVENKIMQFKKGDVSIIFKDQIHIAQSNKSNPSIWRFASLEPERLLIHLPVQDQKQIIDVLEHSQGINNIMNSEDNIEIVFLTKLIINEAVNRNPNYQQVIKGLVWSLLMILKRSSDGNYDNVTDSQKESFELMAPALEYISKNYANEIRIVELASLCNMSISNFRRIFRRCMKVSPLEYILNIRIQMASILLVNSSDSILNISEKVGFNTLSSFNRHFKNIMGASPREIRNK